MIMPIVVLVTSAGLFMFYLQGTCERILRRAFQMDYSKSLVQALQLQFLRVRNRIEEQSQPADYASLQPSLQADFCALTFLLKQTNSPSLLRSGQHYLLRGYFRCLLLALGVLPILKFGESATLLKLSRILEYFSTELGQRWAELGIIRLSAASGVVSH